MQGMYYLSLILYPLVFAWAIYSLLTQPHRNWWSWFIGSAANGVYAFGFLMMTPQIFINYKLKSVAHLPWRPMMYKAFNTFVDDAFAFIIEMPTIHRLATLRDDLIFLIYLYQRYIYPVDKTRANEFGYAYEEKAPAQGKSKKKRLNKESVSVQGRGVEKAIENQPLTKNQKKKLKEASVDKTSPANEQSSQREEEWIKAGKKGKEIMKKKERRRREKELQALAAAAQGGKVQGEGEVLGSSSNGATKKSKSTEMKAGPSGGAKKEKGEEKRKEDDGNGKGKAENDKEGGDGGKGAKRRRGKGKGNKSEKGWTLVK